MVPKTIGQGSHEGRAMRMPRFRIRTLMIAVAVVAVLTACAAGAWRLNRLSRYYRSQAAILSHAEKRATEGLKDQEEELASIAKRDPLARAKLKDFEDVARHCAGQYAALAEHAAALKLKYERAARYPWLPVEPDPPEPEWRDPPIFEN